jgi:ubiquinone biosynthesis protein
LARRRIDLGDDAAIADLGPRLRTTLEEAGGLFVKLGQVASTRSDLLPAALCNELAKLQSHVRPDPPELIRVQLEEELGMPAEEAFATFDWEPIASASIAQVYAATGHDGRPWVVKVRRPGLEEQIQHDSDAVLLLARIIEHHTALGLRISPTNLAEEFLAGVHEELDFRIEVGNARSLAAATPAGAGVRIPAIDAARSTRKVLIEERVDGIELGELDRVRAAGHDPAVIAQRLVEVVLGQLFHSGVFHADPHPGNVLVEADGTIALIDFGAVGHLGKQQRMVIVQLMVGAVTSDATTLRQALEQAGVTGDALEGGALDRAIDEFLGRHMQVGGGIDATVFEDLMGMLSDFGLHPPRWMGSLGRTFVTLEGTLRTVDPHFSLVDAATAMGTSIVAPDLEPGSIKEVFEAQVFKQLPRIQRIPQRLDDLLGQAAEGRLSVRLSAFSHQKDADTITTLVNRVVLALLASALGLGSTILLHVDLDPARDTGVTVNEILGYVGLTIAGVLMLRVVATIVRDGRS